MATFLGIQPPNTLYLHFKKTGLLHILAISGFHFGLICFCIHLFLRKLLSSKTLAILQILFMSFYFCLLDSSFSITRAYILILIFYLGNIFCKKSNLLNTLSLAFFIEVIIHPSCILQLGMQLSYLITLSLICFYPRISKYFLNPIPILLHEGDRFLAFILKSFYKTLAIGCCVNGVALPILLYHFQEFGLLSLIYNLFMPQLLSFCMMGALFSIFLYPFCSFASQSISLLTNTILECIEYLPIQLDHTLYLSMPPWLIAALFCLLFFIFLHQEKMIHGPKTAHLLHYSS